MSLRWRKLRSRRRRADDNDQSASATRSTRKGPSAVEPVVLLMPDGSTETIHCHDVPGLLGQALHGPRTPVMELIARSVSSSEPDGAHMIDLVRALLNGPVADVPGTRG